MFNVIMQVAVIPCFPFIYFYRACVRPITVMPLQALVGLVHTQGCVSGCKTFFGGGGERKCWPDCKLNVDK